LVSRGYPGGELADRYNAGQVLAARDLVVKHVDAAELHAAVAAVLSVAADAIFVKHILEFDARLVTSLAHLHLSYLVRRRSLEVGRTREKKGVEERRNARFYVW
jgi:hypothetical protein